MPFPPEMLPGRLFRHHCMLAVNSLVGCSDGIRHGSDMVELFASKMIVSATRPSERWKKRELVVEILSCQYLRRIVKYIKHGGYLYCEMASFQDKRYRLSLCRATP